ncbi:MAG TPA: hypothetical protein VGX03_15525 [Candidatus Binatia bacterium]|nr:hypothetical protein [Candidatus Binatia bacterium]
MTEVMITEGMKQQVITRLATINSAISIFNLTNGKPAKVSVEEVLGLAECIERWAWRDLFDEQADTRAPDKPASRTTPAKPALSKVEGAEPEPAAEKGDREQPSPAPPKANGHGQHVGEASEKQINAIFGIGKSKGHSSEEITAWIKKRFGKDVDALTSREASKVIGDLQAL